MKLRSMKITLCVTKAIVVGMLLICFDDGALARDYELDREEVQFMKQLMAKDELIRSLPDAQTGLASLNKILSVAAAGPIKIALSWNQVAIRVWRVANTKLEAVAKASICDEIDLRIAYDGNNTDFFEQLYEARGCKPQ